MFKLEKNYQGANFKLEAGVYSREELTKIVGGNEGTLNFLLLCTDLKDYIKEVTTPEQVGEVTEEVITPEQVKEELKIVFLVQKDIKKGKKTLFKEGKKLDIEDLEGFEISKLIEEGFLLETKVSK